MRAPSKNCLLRIRKAIRTAVSKNFEDTAAAAQVPYKMDGPERKINFPPPTAVDRHGDNLTPERAIQQRVEARLQGAPEEDMPTMPLINTTAYEYISTAKAQDRVDRQREALGLERHTGTKQARVGPSRMSSSRTGGTRSCSTN